MYIVRVVCVLCHITLLYWLYTLLYPVYPRRFFFSFLPTFFFLPPPAPRCVAGAWKSFTGGIRFLPRESPHRCLPLSPSVSLATSGNRAAEIKIAIPCRPRARAQPPSSTLTLCTRAAASYKKIANLISILFLVRPPENALNRLIVTHAPRTPGGAPPRRGAPRRPRRHRGYFGRGRADGDPPRVAAVAPFSLSSQLSPRFAAQRGRD